MGSGKFRGGCAMGSERFRRSVPGCASGSGMGYGSGAGRLRDGFRKFRGGSASGCVRCRVRQGSGAVVRWVPEGSGAVPGRFHGGFRQVRIGRQDKYEKSADLRRST